MTRKRPKPRNFLVRYTLQGADLTWGPFEADDMREACDVASKVIPACAGFYEVDEVK